ncbi:hypothetical protein J6590_013302 [Homalodisca vitripennis]|nr:hypothetical protein J6590_013302 [Homalodisca vitripennis]
MAAHALLPRTITGLLSQSTAAVAMIVVLYWAVRTQLLGLEGQKVCSCNGDSRSSIYDPELSGYSPSRQQLDVSRGKGRLRVALSDSTSVILQLPKVSRCHERFPMETATWQDSRAVSSDLIVARRAIDLSPECAPGSYSIAVKGVQYSSSTITSANT